MANAPAAVRDSFQADLSAALEVASRSNTTKTSKAKSTIFGSWSNFCAEQGKAPSLADVPDQQDKLCYILVYLYRYRHNGIRKNSKRTKPIRSGTLSKALTAIGKGISDLGVEDPRFKAGSDKQHPLLADFLKTLSKEDDPSDRSYPINVTIRIRNISPRDLSNVAILDLSSFKCGHAAPSSRIPQVR